MQVALQMPNETTVTPRPNIMAESVIIPLEPNFEDADDIDNIDLLSAICNIEKQQHTPSVPVTNIVANTSNVFKQVPKSFFANCQCYIHEFQSNSNVLYLINCGNKSKWFCVFYKFYCSFTTQSTSKLYKFLHI